jgi:hypothetical protein
MLHYHNWITRKGTRMLQKRKKELGVDCWLVLFSMDCDLMSTTLINVQLVCQMRFFDSFAWFGQLLKCWLQYVQYGLVLLYKAMAHMSLCIQNVIPTSLAAPKHGLRLPAVLIFLLFPRFPHKTIHVYYFCWNTIFSSSVKKIFSLTKNVTGHYCSILVQ